MEPDPKQPLLIDPSILSQLACPACLGYLRHEASGHDGAGLVCTICGSAYPAVDGIPVLIVGRATAALD